MEGRGVPLTEADRAILALECETIAGHTCKVIRVGGDGPGLEEIRARVGERIAGVPALSTIRVDSAALGRHFAALALSRVDGRPPPALKPPADVTLVQREST